MKKLNVRDWIVEKAWQIHKMRNDLNISTTYLEAETIAIVSYLNEYGIKPTKEP